MYSESYRTCVRKKDKRESKDWCYAIWIYAREKNYRCNLHSTADAREICVCKGKFFFAFVDLEKAFDRVPREVTRWALRKAGVDEWLVKAVMAMYKGAQTVGLKRNTGKTKVMFSWVWKIRWKRMVCGPVVYVRRESAIIRFCPIVARRGLKGIRFMASQLFICRSCKVGTPITDGLNTDLHLDICYGV